MKKFFFLLIFLLTNVSANNSFFDNSTIIQSNFLNSNVTFSINCTADYVENAPEYIYLINITTPLRFCSFVNLSTVNTSLDSKDFCLPGIPSGGGGGVPINITNITEFEPTLKCNINSIEQLGLCLNDVGNVIWQGYPNAGILILVLLIYILLLLLAINGLLKNTKTYLKLSFYVLLVLVLFIILIWMLQDCQVEQLGDLKTCVSNFGENIWPGHSYAGILLLGILLSVILIILVLGRQRKKREKKEKV